jgi:hypothetical protein
LIGLKHDVVQVGADDVCRVQRLGARRLI